MPAHTTAPPPLLGVDFTCAPSARKAITVARGSLQGSVLQLLSLHAVPTLPGFETLLLQPGPWLGVFDFPFGLPRAFVDSLQLGNTAMAVDTELHRRCANRMAFRALVDAWGNSRPAGQRLLHRCTDRAQPGVASTSPLQTRYVPVGFMYFEGLRRLLQADVTLPGLYPTGWLPADNRRVALEGYPGLLAFELIGRRSYKNSEAADRRQTRAAMLAALRVGRTRLGVSLATTSEQHQALLVDNSGDLIDAVLCLVQAAWASQQPRYGLPAEVDPVEGWITSAGQV